MKANRWAQVLIMQNSITLLLLFAGLTAYSQTSKPKLIGKFTDNITELKLNADSTFELKTPDYVFPYTFTVYQNRGIWTHSDNVITLNPNQSKRQPKLLLTEKKIEGIDSIEIKINYFTEVYENEVLVSKTTADFELLTLYLNKPKNYWNLVRSPMRRICAFAPRVKKQKVVDSLSIVRLPGQKVERLGIYTYGFEKPIELITTNPNANYFEIMIAQPIDKERTPRSKQVIIKDKYAYFYELDGRIPTSGLLLSGLKRVD